MPRDAHITAVCVTVVLIVVVVSSCAAALCVMEGLADTGVVVDELFKAHALAKVV